MNTPGTRATPYHRERFRRSWRGLVMFAAMTTLAWQFSAAAEKPDTPTEGSDRSIPRTSRSLDDIPEYVRIGTFNIRMFPCNRDCECVRGYGLRRCRGKQGPMTDLTLLGREIRRLDPDILFVNEILDPEELRKVARSKLGPDWRLVRPVQKGAQKVGFLFNTSVVRLLEKRAFDQIHTGLVPGNHHVKGCLRRMQDLRPVYVGKFQVKGTRMDFFVVGLHLKSGRSCSSVRRDQWRIMKRIADTLIRDDKDIIILGDFNDPSKWEKEWSEFAAQTGFTWISEDMRCGHLGRRRKFSLDHVLVSRSMRDAFVDDSAWSGGPCYEGRRKSGYRKRYLRTVSDHYPVMVEFAIPVP